MKSLFDEIENFKTLLDDKEPVKAPDGFDRQAEHEEEAWRLGNFIPTSYVTDDGIRHITVFDEDVEQRYDLVDGKIKQIREVF